MARNIEAVRIDSWSLSETHRQQAQPAESAEPTRHSQTHGMGGIYGAHEVMKLSELESMVLRAAAGSQSGIRMTRKGVDPDKYRAALTRLSGVRLLRMTDTKCWITDEGRAFLAQPPEPVAVEVEAKLASSRKAREKSDPKIETVLAMLGKPKGATLESLMSATGWQAHTVRGRVSTLKSQGHKIESERVDGARVYRVAS